MLRYELYSIPQSFPFYQIRILSPRHETLEENVYIDIYLKKN